MVERIKQLRYLIIAGSLLAMFINIFDVINKSLPISQIIFYCFTLLLIAILLALFHGKWMIAIVCGASGVMMLLDEPNPGKLSAAVMFLSFSMRLSETIYVKILYYVITLLFVTGIHVFKGESPADAINVLIAYSVLYYADELIDNRNRGS